MTAPNRATIVGIVMFAGHSESRPKPLIGNGLEFADFFRMIDRKLRGLLMANSLSLAALPCQAALIAYQRVWAAACRRRPVGRR
jgi:hypothetical protein